MLDAAMRRLIDPPLDSAARRLARLGVGADALTLGGFLIGLGAVPLLAEGLPFAALALILLNRLLDGLDGAVARTGGATDRGGYLDIVCDFVFYAAVPLGFALADPSWALPAAFLIFSFVGSGSTFLAFAIIAGKRGISTDSQGRKSFFYLGGLTEGTETILFFVLICLRPEWFPAAAAIFGMLCLATAAGRAVSAWRAFGEPGR